MATFIGGFGSALKSTGSPTVTYPASVQTGDLVVVYLGTDGTGTPTVSDGSNTFTVSASLVTATATSSKIYEAYSIITVAKTTSDSITFNASGLTSQTTGMLSGAIFRPATGEYFKTSPTSLATAVAGSSGTTVTISGTATSPAIVFGALIDNGPLTDTITADSDTTNGTWSTLTTGTANGTGSSTTSTIRIGTTGASASSNNVIAMQSKILTATGTQSYDLTLGTARAYGLILRQFSIGTALSITSILTSGTNGINTLNIYNTNPITAILTSGTSGKTNESFNYGISSSGNSGTSGKTNESFKYGISSKGNSGTSGKGVADALGTYKDLFIGWGIPL